MEVICLSDEAFYALIETVVARIKEKEGVKGDKWISDEEAMSKLRIKSKTTLQKLRDEGKIRFTQPEKKIILYDTDSIDLYLDKTFKRNFLMELNEKQFNKGFNHGYVLAEYEPPN